MGLLNLLKRINGDNSIRVLVLGLQNSGKTTLVNTIVHLIQNQNEDNDELITSPTDGCEIQKIDFKNNQIHFWDIGGSEPNKEYWHIYFDSTDIIMWVIDSADIDKFEETKNELEAILENSHLSRASLVVVANKRDDSNAAPFPDFLRDLQIDVKQKNWIVICAASKGKEKEELQDELEKCLEWIVLETSSKRKK